MTDSTLAVRPYSPLEESLNAATHGLGFIAAFLGLVFLLLRVDGIYGQIACVVYGFSMMLMFLSSTLYHWVSRPDLKKILKTIDHSAIYILIAGTYTPFMTLAVGGTLGLVAMVLIWSIAIVGIMFKCFANNRFPKLSLVTYLLMGWLAIFFIYPLYNALETTGFYLLLAGGLCYTVGVVFYAAKKIQFTHAIWHVFVAAGSFCHFWAIYSYVI
ncbi:hemolysin III family protein [uncultured Paraglaciecola sp.]|jgi:hemolysin III|uniref:PAQR family membrane homeostasis protein TrhA n=1 Tax=uncultured Paraglaciecola sp. TaxID=1765024 RepID=UPI0025D6A603|nr:hemolysin III family protein [uncultured Paraglaciecola sp.]